MNYITDLYLLWRNPQNPAANVRNKCINEFNSWCEPDFKRRSLAAIILTILWKDPDFEHRSLGPFCLLCSIIYTWPLVRGVSLFCQSFYLTWQLPETEKNALRVYE